MRKDGPVTTDELAGRYGRPMSRARRRLFAAVAAALLALGLGYAAWYALTTGNPAVTWQDIGYRNTRSGVDVTFEVTFSSGAGRSPAATCTVQALNQVRTVVGSRDVKVGPIAPSSPRTVQITAALRTSEPANTGLVKTCALS